MRSRHITVHGLVAAPDARGDYAVEFVPVWTGTCIEGGGIAYGRIKVR